MRITAQLVQVSDQTHLWAESYERNLSNVLAIQSEVAGRIARSLALGLLPANRAALAAPPMVDSIAHEVYLKGRDLLNRRTEDALTQSLDYFQRALAQDREYAPGYAGVAEAYTLLADYGTMTPHEAFTQARSAALKALELDPSLSDAHASLAWATLIYDHDFSLAEREFRRAIELNAGSARNHQLFAGFLRMMGRHEEALAEARRAQQLDPLSLIMNAILGWHYYFARDYDRAIEQCRRTVAMDPSFARVHSYLGWAYLQKGQYAEGVRELELARSLFGRDSPAREAELAYGYALEGRAQEARRLVKELDEASRRRYVEADLVGKVYVALGEYDRAIQWLNKAVDEHSVKLVQANVEPMFDPLRGDPRFRDLLRRLGFVSPS